MNDPLNPVNPEAEDAERDDFMRPLADLFTDDDDPDDEDSEEFDPFAGHWPFGGGPFGI